MRSPPFLSDRIVVISDLVEHHSGFPKVHGIEDAWFDSQADVENCEVLGGYLERLPLAAVRSGLASHAEIWHHHRGEAVHSLDETPFLTRRAFPISHDAPPFGSEVMLRFIQTHGAPRILCVYGLGVSEELLQACSESFIIYNSIDVPSLRVPPEVSRHFDLVLTGAPWQSEEVEAQHPRMQTAVLPVGPEFASPDTFFPIAEEEKRYDVVYVAAAQAYKRHDILFAALARSPRPLTALCVMGYGEDADHLRRQATEMGLAVDFVGPPGVPHSEVNRLMNQSRVGVVCGVDDGAPAILTEYMLAGLPVVANEALRCGLQYILPQTGVAVPADRFEHGILEALSRTDWLPRQTVLERWCWPQSIARLAELASPTFSSQRDVRVQPELVDG